MSRTDVVVTVIVLLASGLVSAQAPPGRQGKPGAAGQVNKAAQTSTGVIRGRVVSAETGAPLRRARVVLNDGQKDARAVSTETDGRYEFEGLGAGRYTITASKAKHVTFQYGQRSGHETGRPVDVGDGEVVDRIDVALPKGGVIAGHVFDDLGEPADYIRVAAMQVRYFDGRRQIVPLASSYVRTNDLGEYRISGLAPGRYYVGTAPPVADSVPRPRAGRVFAASFFPGTSSLADAQAIDIEAGQERTDANFPLVVSRPLKAVGIVMDRRGRPAGGVSVYAKQVMGRGGYFIAARGDAQANGVFAIQDLAPGEYTLSVERTNRTTDAEESATERITIGSADVEGIVMTLAPMLRVTGRIRAEPRGATMPLLKDVSVVAHPLPGSATSQESSTWIASDGTFQFGNTIAGPTRFALNGLPAGWALKAVVYAGRDVIDGLNVREDVSGLELVLTNVGTTLSGAVTDPDNRPVDDYAVIVFADDASRWDNPRYLATARPDQNGRFSVRGLPAGNYLAIAVREVEEGAASDPEYLERLRLDATKLTVRDGETTSVELKIAKMG